MSLNVLVADAVVAALNGGTFDPTFTAVRLYVPRFSLKELETIRVAVVATGIASTPDTRATTQNDVTIQLAVQKKMDSETNETIDELLALAESIAQFLTRQNLEIEIDEEAAVAAWIKTEHAPIYSADMIDEKKVFTSVITAVYRVWTGA